VTLNSDCDPVKTNNSLINLKNQPSTVQCPVVGKFVESFQPIRILIMSSLKQLRPVILKPRIKQTASMIFLHGLGDTGHGWASLLNTIRPDHLKVICPTAPVISVTLNMGLRMPAWFDIESLDNLEEEADMDGMNRSAETVYKLIQGEVRAGIPTDRILIGGFSQGAAVALYSAMHTDKKLGGCIALSTMMPERRLPDPSTIINKDIPYFQAHGETDNILPISHGIATSKILKQFLPNHEFKTYHCQHECTDRELGDVKSFIEKIVGH